MSGDLMSVIGSYGVMRSSLNGCQGLEVGFTLSSKKR